MLLKIAGKISVLLFLILLAGCKAQPIYNVENQQFSASSAVSMKQVEQAILQGCKKAGWRPQVIGPGKIMASYSYKRNKYSALVDINYDLDSYDITYRSSSASLKYTEREAAAGGSDFLSEYNPFDKDEEAPAVDDGGKITIHKAYNQWVKALESAINTSLAMLPLQTAGSSVVTARRSVSGSRPVVAFDCDSKPDSSLSGQVSVIRSSANIRYGANTQCALAGSVHKNETLTLLGVRGNWFYIRTAQDKTAWIYAPLVKKVDPDASENSASSMTDSAVSSKVATANPPPPPASPLPRKKISIAVIQFKTLNKEAQDIALGDLVSETFTSALVNSSAFKIIERAQLDKVIKEMEFSQTGFIETSNAVEVGKMLHADAIITGSVALLGKKIQLNARIIDIESAYVISAETRTTDYRLENVSKIAREIVSSLSQKLNR